jgi:adenine phosphoribosyltransferase
LPELLAESLIRDVPDFPKSGILFKDITPVLAHPEAMIEVMDRFAAFARGCAPDLIVGIESRGFVLGMPLALYLGKGFVPVRKLGKLPHEKISEEYALEYGTNTVEIHSDAVQPGQRVLIMDDLLATGGTAAAAARLVERLGGSVCGFGFLIELGFLDGRKVLPGYDILSLIRYD